MPNAPSPSDLWKQADAEHPNDEIARRERYLALMVEHGHVIDKEQQS